MVTVTVASDGQITIPKDACEQLGLRPGDEVTLIENGDGWQIEKEHDQAAAADAPFDEWIGYVKHRRGQRTDDIIEEMRGW